MANNTQVTPENHLKITLHAITLDFPETAIFSDGSSIPISDLNPNHKKIISIDALSAFTLGRWCAISVNNSEGLH